MYVLYFFQHLLEIATRPIRPLLLHVYAQSCRKAPAEHFFNPGGLVHDCVEYTERILCTVDSIKRTVLLNVLSLLSILFSTVISKKSIKNTVYQEKKSVKS